MTFNELKKEYDCNVLVMEDPMTGALKILFNFYGYTHEETIDVYKRNQYPMYAIEDYTCERAMEAYKNHKSVNMSSKLAEVGMSLNYACKKFEPEKDKPENPILGQLYHDKNNNCDYFWNTVEWVLIKQSVSESYTINFDMSGGKDISVATVFKNCGDHFEEIGVFTGEKAEWIYNNIRHI